MRIKPIFAFAVLGVLLAPSPGRAVTNVFFNAGQTTNFVASGVTSDTLSSAGYLFTCTRDKLFTGGVGLTNPIGRMVRVAWPVGLEAQAVTSGPSPGKAQMVIKRQDGQPFAITSFTAKLLANTAGAGGSIEVMPLLNGEDGLPNPLALDATGIAGNQFTYSTPRLTGFDTYKISLYVDYAVMSLTVVDASPPDPALTISPLGPDQIELAWPTNAGAYTLQTTTNLLAAAWSDLTDGITVNGDWFSVQLDAVGPRRFYRLRK